MSINSKGLTYFQDKESFNGKKERILTIECNKCLEINNNFYENESCVSCFLKNLHLNKNKEFKHVLISGHNKLIEHNNIEPFLDYFNYLTKIKKFLKRIQVQYRKKCPYKDFECKIFPNLSNIFSINTTELYNPIILYNLLTNLNKDIKEETIIDSLCRDCSKYIKTSLKNALKVLEEQKMILAFNKFKIDNKNYHHLSDFYKLLLNKSEMYLENIQQLDLSFKQEKDSLIESYKVGPYDLYDVLIFSVSNEYEKRYVIKTKFDIKFEDLYFTKIINDVEKNLEFVKIDQIIPLEALLKVYKNEAVNYIDSKYKFSLNEKKKIAFLASLKRINLEKLFPLLVDDLIEEIFLDSPHEAIYINHQRLGRCRTDIKFNSKEINRLKTLLRIYSSKRLDYVNPSVKLVIKNKYFYCRFSVDVKPIHLSNFALDIRKLNKNILNIQDLLQNKTLNPYMAAFLYFAILRRKNITVTGETDTGKTTLINALDLLTPKEFRKIYIENVIESLNQSKFFRHQLKYKVDSLEESINHKFSKQNQIKKLLHRTPDIIYLGEILTKGEAEAMFHCLAAGLRGFQTIHSKNIDSLINRIIHHFQIHSSCLHDLDLIILMKKSQGKRRIFSISEINPSFEKTIYKMLFKYNPEIKQWDSFKELYNSHIITQLKQHEHITYERFHEIIKIYSDIFEILSNIDKISNIDLIKLFDKISFYSFNSLDLLRRFWEKWKKFRTLNY